METQHLNQYELAKRWRMSQRTLEWRRWMRQGPPYLKIVYKLCDIETYEMTSLRNTGEGARGARRAPELSWGKWRTRYDGAGHQTWSLRLKFL